METAGVMVPARAVSNAASNASGIAGSVTSQLLPASAAASSGVFLFARPAIVQPSQSTKLEHGSYKLMFYVSGCDYCSLKSESIS